MCIAVAMDRDASSGGCIRLAIITKDGKLKYFRIYRTSLLSAYNYPELSAHF